MSETVKEVVSQLRFFEEKMKEKHKFLITHTSGHNKNPFVELGGKEFYCVRFEKHGRFVLYTEEKKIIHYTSSGEGGDVKAVAAIAEGLREILTFIALSKIFEGGTKR